jgi:hypothetical protein
LLFLSLALFEAYAVHSWRFRLSWLSIVQRRPVTMPPLEPDCLAAHPWDPGICALDATQRATVEWVRANFPPDRLPVVYSDDTVARIRMRYYARTPWVRRRETHCVLYFSEARERLRAWRDRKGSTVAGPKAVLGLPDSSTANGGPPDLDRAVVACRDLPPLKTAPLPDVDAVLEECRATPPRFDATIEMLGLGGIEVGVTPRRTSGDPETTLLARAFLVTAGTSIDSVALLLRGPDESERTYVRSPDTATYSVEIEHLFPLPRRHPKGIWVLIACAVDSEGFASTAAKRLTLR